MKTLEKKVAIVTGAASGIGEAIAFELGARGACVMVSDIQDETGKQVAQKINMAGGKAAYVHCDISCADQVDAMVSTTVEVFGRLDTLCANAGRQIEKKLLETTENDWDCVMDTNLKGTFLCCRSAVQQMLKTGGGSIIATGSVLSHVAEPVLAAYCASKGGILQLIKSIATDYGTQDIRANCVCPGYINTPLGDGYFEIQTDPQAARAAADAMHALGRMGEPEEVARCVAFLASDDASFITGSSLVVDGGLIAKV